MSRRYSHDDLRDHQHQDLDGVITVIGLILFVAFLLLRWLVFQVRY